MTDTILTVIWPFVFALSASVIEIILARTKAFGRSHVRDLKLPKGIRLIKWKDKTGNTALSFLIIWAAALLQFLFSMVSIFVVRKFACMTAGTAGSPVSPAFFAVADAVSDICILYLLRSEKRRLEKTAVIVALLSYVILFAELFVFNFNCFKKDCHSVTLKGNSLVPEFSSDPESEDSNFVFSGDSVLLKDECSFFIPGVPDDTYSVTVNFTPVDNKEDKKANTRFVSRLLIEDDNSKFIFRTADKRKVSGERSVSMFMRPHGHIKSVMLSIEDLEKNCRIDSVILSERNIYCASFARYMMLFIAASLIVMIICQKFYEVEYDPKNNIHVILLTFVFVLTTGLTFCLYFRKDIKLDKYPFENKEKVLDIYQLAFDARMKKLPYLDIEAEEELKDLDNPYDDSERDEKGITYKWDFAYKDGHYYCYFGEAPIYTFYYPVYLLTRRLPDSSAASGFFGTAAVAAVILAFLAVVRMFVPRKNLLALLLMMPAVASASLLYVNMTYSEKYYIASNSAIAGIGFAVFFGLSAVMYRKKITRFIMFFLSGVSLAVCAGSRPTAAICAAVLLPVFFGVLLDKTRKLSDRLIEALVFLIPVMTGIVLIMNHNFERFGNVFDFGENYQLTVSDVSSLKVLPEMLPSAIFYYFLMPFNSIDTFPYFEARGIIANTYEVYRNIEPSVGLLNIPFLLLGVLFLPGAFEGTKKRLPQKDKTVFNCFLLMCVLASVFIAWFDFSRAGVCLRYLSDFAWLLAIMSGVVLLRRIMGRSGRKTVYGLICIASVLTVFVAFFIMLARDTSNLAKIYPSLLERCEDFFLFWH